MMKPMEQAQNDVPSYNQKSKIKNQNTEESIRAIQRMIALLEPIMLVVLGVIIGFIVVSIIQPIFQMYESIG